ncbi:MAG: 7-cyano-7-deazaguanine synthase QueC [Candidatus Lernaella stagnicola]|nr:7-cyano-7-deazaguanine synthase QueC [Candidatus Lernaella stagnicola]
MSDRNTAVVLVSGGLDSATVLAIAQQWGFAVHALTFTYGQRHVVEVERAQAVCRAAGVAAHKIVPLDLRWMGGSALTDDIDVPKERSADEIATGIPVTYVPARNTIFLSVALGYAETVGAFDILIGINALDYSGYPDCRPEFLAAFETTANLATQAAVEGRGRFAIHAPLIDMTKGEIVRRAVELEVNLANTHSCYDPDAQGRPCGRCDSCLLRAKGFAAAGLPDPALVG